MALIYPAELHPTKLDLLGGWLPGRPWSGDLTGLTQLAAYRFDDPDDEVGMESFLLGTDAGTVLHAPLTYRGAPLEGADAHLVGTMDHSVLGQRWVYDGCADPVWLTALATAALTGGTQAELIVDHGGGRLVRDEPTATVRGSGRAGASVPMIATPACQDEDDRTVVTAGDLTAVVARRIGTSAALPASGAATLAGSWGSTRDALLATVSRAA